MSCRQVSSVKALSHEGVIPGPKECNIVRSTAYAARVLYVKIIM